MAELSKEISILEGKGVTWENLLQRWKLDAEDGVFKKFEPSTINEFVQTLRKWLQPWNIKSVSETNKADGRELQRRMEKSNLAIRTQRRIKASINILFEYGVLEKLIPEGHPSPVAGIQFDNTGEKVPDILDLNQIRYFLEQAKKLENPWYPIWALALMTGMRSGELFALEWSDVDFERSLIRVSKSFSSRIKGIKSTKAGYWRNVPISTELKGFLLELKGRTVSRKSTDDAKYVLPRHHNWEKGFQAQVLKTFLKGIGLPEIKFHALRACFATHLLSQNVPAAVVMKICGWKNYKTMDFYLRLAGVNEFGATESLKIS